MKLIIFLLFLISTNATADNYINLGAGMGSMPQPQKILKTLPSEDKSEFTYTFNVDFGFKLGNGFRLGIDLAWTKTLTHFKESDLRVTQNVLDRLIVGSYYRPSGLYYKVGYGISNIEFEINDRRDFVSSSYRGKSILFGVGYLSGMASISLEAILHGEFGTINPEPLLGIRLNFMSY